MGSRALSLEQEGEQMLPKGRRGHHSGDESTEIGKVGSPGCPRDG